MNRPCSLHAWSDRMLWIADDVWCSLLRVSLPPVLTIHQVPAFDCQRAVKVLTQAVNAREVTDYSVCCLGRNHSGGG